LLHEIRFFAQAIPSGLKGKTSPRGIANDTSDLPVGQKQDRAQGQSLGAIVYQPSRVRDISSQMNRDDLVAAYSAPNRYYHNLTHVEDCLGALAGVDDLSATDREILTGAIWWHDVVYDPTRSDNEELSARLAEQHVIGDIRQEVGRLIRLTKTHLVEPGDRLGAILISIDLSILAAEPSRYDAYAAAIRKEFAHVPDGATIARAAPACSRASRRSP
jgi:predicted metal-dependent HD superfamily phosphohydrolase